MRISLCLSISWQKLCFTLTFTTQPRISIIWVSLLHVAFFTLSRTFLWTPFQTLLKLDAVVMKPVSASLVVILLSLPQQQQQLLQFWHNSIRIDVNVLFIPHSKVTCSILVAITVKPHTTTFFVILRRLFKRYAIGSVVYAQQQIDSCLYLVHPQMTSRIFSVSDPFPFLRFDALKRMQCRQEYFNKNHLLQSFSIGWSWPTFGSPKSKLLYYMIC